MTCSCFSGKSARLACLVLLLGILSGCGGIETEPPAEAPEPEGEFAYARVPVLESIDATDAGSVTVFSAWPSSFVEPRDIQVWVPPGFDTTGATRYPVLLVIDDLMGADRVMEALLARDAVQPAIVVGIRSTRFRILELAPEDVLSDVFPADTLAEARRQLAAGPGLSADLPLMGNAYLSFLTDELLPGLADRFPTNGETVILGGSMGGLMAVYAIVKRPDVFRAAAAMSTHWPLMGDYMLAWLSGELPFDGDHRLYFDRGTDGADADYAPYQRDVDVLLRTLGVPFTSHVFTGHDHSVAAWQRRMHLPIQYLLGS